MWNLISLKEQSKIKMVEMFYETNEPITINTLSEQTNTSNRSIKNYLEELKETMSEIGGDFESSSEGVNFKIPIHIGIDYFQKQLIRESIGFKLLEKVFFVENLTNNELVNELYISQSTLNRLATTINEGLHPYGLRLETSPYKVVGDEQVIRRFFTTYFVEAYSANEWPFDILKKEIIDCMFPSAVEYYKTTSEVMNYTFFKFRFAVGLIRNLQGYSVENKFLENEYLADYYHKLTAELNHNIDHFSFKSLEEKNIYVTQLAINQLLTSKHIFYDRLKHDQNLKKRFEEIEHMIMFLSDNFELPIEDMDNLIVELESELLFFSQNLGNIQPKQYILYPSRDYLLVDLYQRSYPTFYDLVKYYILFLCKNRDFVPKEETLKYLIYSFISKWKDLTKYLFNRYNTVTLKIYSHLNLRHAENVAESLISDLPTAVKVSILKEPFLNEEIISKYDFDILVSTETLILDIEQPIVYMYKSRSSFQYDYLYKQIKEIAEQKEKTMRDKFYEEHGNKLLEYEAYIKKLN